MNATLRWTALVLSALLLQSAASAQDKLPTDPGKGPVKGTGKDAVKEPVKEICSDPINFDCCCNRPSLFWARGEYLLWWTRGDHLPPLVTTSPTGTPIENAGILGVPGTTVLFGDSFVNNSARSGFRITLGSWLNDCRDLGVEADFFMLEKANTRFTMSSNGDPIIARPFFDVTKNEQNALLIAFPGLLRGSVDITASSNFYGAEALVRKNICDDCCRRLDCLIGYRYLRLDDTVDIREVEINTGSTQLPLGTRFDLEDSFGSRNQFNGCLLGLEGEIRRGCWAFCVRGQVSLGATQREVAINGNTAISLPGAAPINNVGGLLALPSNIGHYRDTEFTAIPELTLSVKYRISESIRVGIGYNLIYWPHVARAGNQIDLAVNATQPPLGGGLVGDARPAFPFHGSDFWAQGINFLVEFRY